MSGGGRPGRPAPARRAAAAILAVAAAMGAALSGCGDTTSQPAWVPGHPDTALVGFRTTAPGVCAITVQYPNDAPAAITYLGGLYVQVSRLGHPSGSPGMEVDRSGDWHVFKLGNGDLLLVTAADAFQYRVEQNC